MHVLVTGHTGFKGAWLTLMLAEQGHEVSGLALDPEPGSLFERADAGAVMRADVRGDVRDAETVRRAVESAAPDAVVHMAAQPLVRASYRDPRWTLETNVMGTLAVLEAASALPSLGALVVVTTDKVYRNVGQQAGYREEDALGGRDPYSASKAMADLLTTSWATSFPGVPTAIARAGNVVGGGDVSADRLLPDLLRAFAAGIPATLRYPDAVRPWQHVLDCLHGYCLLVETLVAKGDVGADGGPDGAGVEAWNFGPDASSFRTVAEAADEAARSWGDGASWVADDSAHPHEETLLTLDAERAREELGWRDALSFDEAINWTVAWTRRVDAGESARAVTLEQIGRHRERLSHVLAR